ncbi:hypothetical protein FRC10_011694, partial [Ceratobasidium sp. 414]
MSMLSKMCELLLREEPTPSLDSAAHLPSLAHWLSHALDLQATQRTLFEDSKSIGSKPTSTQSLSLTNRRKAVLAEVEAMRTEAAKYFNLSQAALEPDEPVTEDGHPEHLKLYLPSDYALPPVLNPVHMAAVAAEKDLRRVLCLQDLQLVRSLTMQRVHLQDSQQKHTRGIIATTHASSLQGHLWQRLMRAQAMYNLHRDKLLCLGMTPEDRHAFRILTADDLKSLMIDVGKVQLLGDGRNTVPWYWHVTLPDLSDVQVADSSIKKE